MLSTPPYSMKAKDFESGVKQPLLTPALLLEFHTKSEHGLIKLEHILKEFDPYGHVHIDHS